METIEPYSDARLVALYDVENPDGPDHDFYRALAADISARRIMDLGCGTGLLTRTLVKPGRVVVGVDPSAVMLDFAGRQPGGDRVSWVLGDARDLTGRDADLAIMTGNVAQIFLTDREWHETLACLHRALRQGGTLAFEARNPAAGAWRSWTKNSTYNRRRTSHGPLIKWVDNTREHNGVLTFEAHTVFAETGQHLVSQSGLRFRSAEEIQQGLARNGFLIRGMYGDWVRGPLSATSRIMVFVATSAS